MNLGFQTLAEEIKQRNISSALRFKDPMRITINVKKILVREVFISDTFKLSLKTFRQKAKAALWYKDKYNRQSHVVYASPQELI